MFDPTFLIIGIPVILLTITIHEYSHAKVADILGDPTPRLSGRLSLNPISHIDPIGFLMLMIVRFGWAKPVPINPNHFKNPKRDMVYVSLAGPLSNFFFAWILAIILKNTPISFGGILQYAIWLNLGLAVFNLIPIPPLDGSKILEGILPDQYYEYFRAIDQYGFFILILVILFPGTSELLMSTVQFMYTLLML